MIATLAISRRPSVCEKSFENTGGSRLGHPRPDLIPEHALHEKGLQRQVVSFRIDPQGSVCTNCRTGCRVSARIDCLCTRHRRE